MATDMKRIVLTMDANRMPLPFLMNVLGMISHLEEMALDIGDGILTISEQMDQQEAVSRLPKPRAEALSEKKRKAETISPPVEEQPARTLTDGQQAILTELQNAGQALRRSEIAAKFADKKGNVIGTWLHGLERRGLISSEPGDEETIYKIAMADA